MNFEGDFQINQKEKRVTYRKVIKTVSPRRILLQDESGLDIQGNMMKETWMRADEFISDWETATRPCARVNFSITSIWFGFVWIILEEGQTFDQARWQEHMAQVSQEQAESLDMILVVDNHRIHFAQTSRDKVSQLGWNYPVTQFSAYSPDLQPLQNLFESRKKCSKDLHLRGRKEVEERLNKVLQHLSWDESCVLIRNFRKRCEEVVEKEGGRLDY